MDAWKRGGRVCAGSESGSVEKRRGIGVGEAGRMNLNSNEKRRSNTRKPISADVIAFLGILLGVG